MIVYFDTSAAIPLVIQEAGSAIALRLWKEAQHVVSSRLIVAESAAAISLGNRIGRVADSDHEVVQNDAAHLVRELILIDVSAEVIDHAADLAVRRSLRGYDAVHLSTALQLHAVDTVFASGDQLLLAAAALEGLHTVDTSTRGLPLSG